jgi:hypothetical protein
VQIISIIDVSQQLLLAAKTRQPTDTIVSVIESISIAQLKSQLINDRYKKAFWINLYNAFTQIILLQSPEKYQHRRSFFTDKIIVIAGESLSLENIEHDILRRSKLKWSLGYLNKPFPSSFEKQNRVQKVDYRIHFALNCGAKSCPPIAFYKPELIDKQLDVATKSYLEGNVVYEEDKNTVALPPIMMWFKGDFGGKKKVLELLKKIGIVPVDKKPQVSYSKYDWDLYLENYNDK